MGPVPRPGAERHRTHRPHAQARGHTPTHLHGHRDPDGSRGDRLLAGQRTVETFRLSLVNGIDEYEVHNVRSWEHMVIPTLWALV